MNTTFCILGGAGDLAGRLLIPGIAQYLEQYDHDGVRLLGVGREDVDYPAFVGESLSTAGTALNDDRLIDSASFIAGDATDPATLNTIVSAAADTRLVLYFALAPAVIKEAVDALADVDLPKDTILAIEKPFGTSASEADDLDAALADLLPEDQIVRIDHFLHETPVINLVGLLRTTALIANSWNSQSIESITVLFDEDLTLEGRADFYESTGAAVDMLQSHLLQSLARVLAGGGPANEILDAMEFVDGSARRARYTAGEIDGERVPSYVDEEGVDPYNETETLAQFQVRVNTEQWRDTIFTLRSGKAIGNPRQEFEITYRDLDSNPDQDADPARLIVPFEDALALEVPVPDHGRAGETTNVVLTAAADYSELTPYGRVARGILNEDDSVGVDKGAPQRAWRIMEPVLEAFTQGTAPMEEYPAGSQGPDGWL